jgi:hypothetical protein
MRLQAPVPRPAYVVESATGASVFVGEEDLECAERNA